MCRVPRQRQPPLGSLCRAARELQAGRRDRARRELSRRTGGLPPTPARRAAAPQGRRAARAAGPPAETSGGARLPRFSQNG
eukprot:scaffold28041_cov33-Tisochrysis_lutea.AAC.2